MREEILTDPDQGYVTKPGVDEREIPYPSTYTEDQVNELKRLGIKFINWNGTAMAIGPGMSTEFYNEIASRKKQRRSVILALIGAPGEGKTWSGLRLAEIFDKKFSIEKQVCFSREHLMKIISGKIKIKPGQCVLLDEAHMAAGARHWFEDIQKDLVDQVATIRSMGIILIFVVLHLSMLDKIIRQFVLTYQLHMEQRGVVIQYKVTMPRWESKVYHPRQGRIALAVPGVYECASPDCLWCSHRDWCMNMRAVYERNKKVYLAMMSEKSAKKAEKKRLKDEPMTIDEQFQIVRNNTNFLIYTQRGTIDPSSIRDIFEKESLPIGLSMATDLAKRIQRKYPELKPPEEKGDGI